MAKLPFETYTPDKPDPPHYTQKPHFSSRLTLKKELEAKFERLWLIDPDQFNPLRNCMEKERLERTWSLLLAHTELVDKQILDLGCAAGVFSRRLRDGGAAHVEAVDIAQNALKHVREHNMDRIATKQEALPITSLPDNGYDIVVCTDVIAYLPLQDYRLFFSELSRLVKMEGYVICSTPIDINTEGGVQQFIEMAQTEFLISGFTPSYHAFYLKLTKLLEGPATFVKMWKDSKLRKKELESRNGLNRFWFWMNSTPLLFWVWTPIQYPCNWVLSYLKNSRSALLGLERVCKFLSDESGISHIAFVGKRRPLVVPEPDEQPVVRPGKKEIWE